MRSLPGMQPDRMFPKLTQAQIERIAMHGHLRQVKKADVLVEVGEQPLFYVVKEGQVNIISLSGPSEEIVAVQFEGAGLYYGATFLEAQLCKGQEVVVVGGGNSAGQAAVFLSQYAKHVYMLIRSSGLTDTMSRYLIRRIEENPKISLKTQTEIIKLVGTNHLESLSWRDNQSRKIENHDISHVFLMIGAVPNTSWLNNCVLTDTQGFIKTGPDITKENLTVVQWPLERAPYFFETSLPGVFAVGDVRSGNLKRLASAVGEGSNAVFFVHQVLHE